MWNDACKTQNCDQRQVFLLQLQDVSKGVDVLFKAYLHKRKKVKYVCNFQLDLEILICEEESRKMFSKFWESGRLLGYNHCFVQRRNVCCDLYFKIPAAELLAVFYKFRKCWKSK